MDSIESIMDWMVIETKINRFILLNEQDMEFTPNSIMIEWKKWIVYDECVIEDNDEQK